MLLPRMFSCSLGPCAHRNILSDLRCCVRARMGYTHLLSPASAARSTASVRSCFSFGESLDDDSNPSPADRYRVVYLSLDAVSRE